MANSVRLMLLVGGALVLGGLCCLGSAGLWVVVQSPAGPAPGASQAPPPTSEAFAFEPPAGFQPGGEGLWRREQRDGTELLWVEARRLPALPGLDEVEAKLTALWLHLLRGAWPDLGPPLVQRRFVQNGAKAHFARTRLLRPGTPDPLLVSLYLVEAGDRLEPVLLTQGCDTQAPGALMIITYSFSRTHLFVEELLGGIRGSPAGGPLVSDAELTGRFVLGDAGTLQWVDLATGGTAVTAVTRAVELDLAADHTYTYRFAGGSGRAGEIRFGTDTDRGEWHVEHDVLVLSGQRRQAKHLLVGASRGPEGRWLLLLQPGPDWSQGPQATCDVYVRQ